MGIEALLSTQIIDTTTVGRAVMTAVDAAAARTALGLGTLATQNGTITDYLTTAAAVTTYQPLDGDLTALAALSGTNNIYYRSAANTWSSVTIGTGLTFTGGTLAASGGSGISSLNGLTDATQTFAAGTTGTDVAWVSAAGVHTLNIPSASATARGLVTTAAQTFAGDKTHTGNLITSGYAQVGSATPRVRLTQNGITNFNGGVDYNIISWTGGQCIEAIKLTGFPLNGLNVQRVGNDTWLTVNFGTNVTGASGQTPRSALDVRGTASIAGNIFQHNGTTPVKIEAYNTYTSDTSFERLSIGWSSNVCTITTEKGSAGGTLRGLRIGDASTALLGFYGATPVDRPDTVADPSGGGTIDTEARTAINAIIDRLQELGLIA